MTGGRVFAAEALRLLACRVAVPVAVVALAVAGPAGAQVVDSVVPSSCDPVVVVVSDPVVASSCDPVVASSSDPVAVVVSDPVVASSSDPVVASSSDPVVASSSDPVVVVVSDPVVASSSDPVVVVVSDPTQTLASPLPLTDPGVVVVSPVDPAAPSPDPAVQQASSLDSGVSQLLASAQPVQESGAPSGELAGLSPPADGVIEGVVLAVPQPVDGFSVAQAYADEAPPLEPLVVEPGEALVLKPPSLSGSRIAVGSRPLPLSTDALPSAVVVDNGSRSSSPAPADWSVNLVRQDRRSSVTPLLPDLPHDATSPGGSGSASGGGAASSAGGSAGGTALSLALAVLICAASGGLCRRLRLAALAWRPLAFVSPIVRPG